MLREVRVIHGHEALSKEVSYSLTRDAYAKEDYIASKLAFYLESFPTPFRQMLSSLEVIRSQFCGVSRSQILERFAVKREFVRPSMVMSHRQYLSWLAIGLSSAMRRWWISWGVKRG